MKDSQQHQFGKFGQFWQSKKKKNSEKATINFAFYPLLLADLISPFPGKLADQ